MRNTGKNDKEDNVRVRDPNALKARGLHTRRSAGRVCEASHELLSLLVAIAMEVGVARPVTGVYQKTASGPPFKPSMVKDMSQPGYHG